MGEAALAFLLPRASPTSVDVLFVLDITGSMSNEIDGVKNGITNFVANLGKRDVRVGLIAFGDQCLGEENKVLSFPSGTFTRDTTAFSQAIGKISLTGGGDEPETSFDALILGAHQSLSATAIKVMVLITDAPPHVRGRETENCGKPSSYRAPADGDVIRALKDAQINQLHLVVPSGFQAWYSSLQGAMPGEMFPLGADGRQNFDLMLPKIGERIAMAIGSGSVEAQQGPMLIVATAVWTALLAIGAFLGLITAQNLYLQSKLIAFNADTMVAVLGVAVTGILAGASGQWLTSIADTSHAFDTPVRIIAWAVLGGVLSRGLAFFIPNLSAPRVFLGGALGGALGALGFIWMTSIGIGGNTGDIVGRFTGVTLLGILLGLMISIVERVFRECWLEVRYGTKEARTVNLGAEPVSFGSEAESCTFFVANVPPRAYAYRLEQGKIICQDLARGRSDVVIPGHWLQIGNLNVTVCGNVTKAMPVTSVQNAHHQTKPSDKAAYPASGLLSLRFSSGLSFPLTAGYRFAHRDIPGLEPQSAGGMVAEINQNPQDPSVLGLKNLSVKAWEAVLPDGRVLLIPNGKSVKLVAGSRIKFGAVEGEITRQDESTR